MLSGEVSVDDQNAVRLRSEGEPWLHRMDAWDAGVDLAWLAEVSGFNERELSAALTELMASTWDWFNSLAAPAV